MSLKDFIISLFKNSSANPKIVGKEMGRMIEERFIDQDKLDRVGYIRIEIEDIERAFPEYPSGNGHPYLRDGSRGGGQIGYLIYKYNVEKIHADPNNENSSLIAIIIRKK